MNSDDMLWNAVRKSLVDSTSHGTQPGSPSEGWIKWATGRVIEDLNLTATEVIVDDGTIPAPYPTATATFNEDGWTFTDGSCDVTKEMNAWQEKLERRVRIDGRVPE